MVALLVFPSKAAGIILTFMNKHHDVISAETFQQIFLQKNRLGWNALMQAAVYHPETVRTILNLLKESLLTHES